MAVRVVMNRAAVNEFRGWHGPVGRSVNRLAKETEFRARATAPVGNFATYAVASSLPYKKPPHPPGRLKANHKTKKGRWARGISFEVGSDVGYALYVHEGTGPHPIKAKRGRLMFWWPKVGQVVTPKAVLHPGTRANPWLTRALERSMRMWQRGG